MLGERCTAARNAAKCRCLSREVGIGFRVALRGRGPGRLGPIGGTIAGRWSYGSAGLRVRDPTTFRPIDFELTDDCNAEARHVHPVHHFAQRYGSYPCRLGTCGPSTISIICAGDCAEAVPVIASIHKIASRFATPP
jgi:hypothetical protein